jgi:hypothetical protein
VQGSLIVFLKPNLFFFRYPEVLSSVQASAYKMAASIRAAGSNASQQLEAAKMIILEKAGSLPSSPAIHCLRPLLWWVNVTFREESIQ